MKSFEDVRQVQEALLENRVEVLVVQHSYFFEITRPLHSFVQFEPLTLQDIYLQVGVNVVDQEAHVLSQLQSQPKHGLLV